MHLVIHSLVCRTMWGGCHMAPSQRKCGWRWLTVFGSTLPNQPPPPPEKTLRRGSKAMWTCSLLCAVWVTCTQEEGVVIHHHPLDQTDWLTTIVKSTNGWVSVCATHLLPDRLCKFKTNGRHEIHHVSRTSCKHFVLCSNNGLHNYINGSSLSKQVS